MKLNKNELLSFLYLIKNAYEGLSKKPLCQSELLLRPSINKETHDNATLSTLEIANLFNPKVFVFPVSLKLVFMGERHV